jgi:predicted ribosome quality control (RQC) complex YloA/Tae2 family protein
VDYTRIKHVWKPRGAPAGQVHYTDQKTVFVDGTLPD